MAVIIDIDPTDTERIAVLQCEFYHRDKIKGLPGASWSNRDALWKLPLSWTSCLALRGAFGDDLVVQDDLSRWASQEFVTRVQPALAVRESLTVDDMPDEYQGTPLAKTAIGVGEEMGLYPHQVAGAVFMAYAQSCTIADETGTGKSAQLIAASRTLHRLGNDLFPMLIVAPNSMKITWKREWARFWPGIQVQIVEGSAGARRKQLETPAHVYVINWELLAKHSKLAKYGNTALRRCVECGGIDRRVGPNRCEVHKRELNHLRFKTVVADEIQRAKAPTAKQTRALWAIGDAADYRFGLTGTPMQDNISDYWSLLRFVAPKEWSSKTRFVDRYVDVSYNIWGALEMRGIKPDTKEEFFKASDPRFRRMTKKACLPFLPPIVRVTKTIDMHPAQKKAYEQMVTNMIVELEDSDPLVAKNTLSKSTRLTQFASAYAEVIDTELPDGRIESKARMKEPSNKIDAFLEDLEAGDFTGPVIVFSPSRQLLNLLSARLEKKKIEHGLIVGGQDGEERQAHIDKFQAGATKVILVSVKAGGVGLTLTAADTMVFLSRPWSSIDNIQAEARGHRIGSEIHESVTIVDYVSRGTIDEIIARRLDDKFDRIEELTRDAALLAKVLKGEITE